MYNIVSFGIVIMHTQFICRSINIVSFIKSLCINGRKTRATYVYTPYYIFNL